MTSGDVMITMNVRYQGRKLTTSSARLILIFNVRYLKKLHISKMKLRLTINYPKGNTRASMSWFTSNFRPTLLPSKVHQDWFHPSLCNFQRGWFVNKHVIKIRTTSLSRSLTGHTYFVRKPLNRQSTDT